MKLSITYYIVKYILKLKGIKRNFSENPINYLKIRKEDIHTQKSLFYRKNSNQFIINETTITELKKNSEQLIIYIHGGAFISGPSQHHWDTIKTIFNKKSSTIWMVDYPKAPENDITEISRNIDEVYSLALKSFKPENIILIGDSAGGTLILSLTQRIAEIQKPKKIILISPVLDASFNNPSINIIQDKDIILSPIGVKHAKQLCVGNNPINDPRISPLFGSVNNLPEIILFLATDDITYPDQCLFVEKLKINNVKHHVYIGEGLPHIWPLLPVMKESKIALNNILEHL